MLYAAGTPTRSDDGGGAHDDEILLENNSVVKSDADGDNDIRLQILEQRDGFDCRLVQV